jgi:hypothetical protein
MAKRKLSPRKLLVASTGVMTVSYLVACSRTSSPASDQNAMETTTDVTPVGEAPGNTRPNGVGPNGTPGDVGPNPNTQPPFTSCIANLPAPPAFPTDSPVDPGPTVTAPPVIANLPAPPTPSLTPPPDPTGIVANLVAPMVPTALPPTTTEPDAGPPDILDAGEPGDAGPDTDGGTRDAGTGGSSGSSVTGAL